MENKYPVPKGIQDLFCKYDALDKLKKTFASLPFGFKLAKKCAIEAEQVRSKLLYEVHTLYPELKQFKCDYWHTDKHIHVTRR
jgi:hypothetical protein